MNGIEGSGPVALSLTQFNQAIGNAVRMSPHLQGAWVAAELSDVRISGGHCYMELIEKNEAGQTVAKLRATIWASRLPYLRRKFFEATGRDIATGMKVLLQGSANHHPLYGLSFAVNDIDPSYTLGDLERLRREILERLHREGVLGRNKALEMPAAPQRIAVVSAEGAAGYGDFMNQLEANREGFVFYPFLFPAVMQGERTSQSVRDALSLIKETASMWDCVAIVRGGGATTDLNGFDDYMLARDVALFPLPVVVGIGHERDRNVLDEIAHTRMKTPTAAAAFFVDSVRNAWETACSLAQGAARYTSDRLLGESRRIANCEALVPSLAKSRISEAKALLDRELTRIPVLVGARLQGESSRLSNIGNMVSSLSKAVVDRTAAKIDKLTAMVDVLSPENTLRRGYSITLSEGKAVRDASALKPGDEITTRFAGGCVVSEVKANR